MQPEKSAFVTVELLTHGFLNATCALAVLRGEKLACSSQGHFINSLKPEVGKKTKEEKNQRPRYTCRQSYRKEDKALD